LDFYFGELVDGKGRFPPTRVLKNLFKLNSSKDSHWSADILKVGSFQFEAG
jgi:hypothetical protein